LIHFTRYLVLKNTSKLNYNPLESLWAVNTTEFYDDVKIYINETITPIVIATRPTDEDWRVRDPTSISTVEITNAGVKVQASVIYEVAGIPPKAGKVPNTIYWVRREGKVSGLMNPTTKKFQFSYSLGHWKNGTTTITG